MFYLTHDRKDSHLQPRLVWQEHERAQLYVYVPNTGKFHLSEAMTNEFFFDQEVLDFEVISDAQAREAVAEDLGRLDERGLKWLVQEYRQNSSTTLDPAQILPKKDDDEREITLSPAQHAKRMRSLTHTTAPGTWITYRTYPPGERQKALTAAYDLRSGKVKAFREIGLQTRVADTTAGHEVQITRTAP